MLQYTKHYHLTDKIFKLLGLTEDPKVKELNRYEQRKAKRTQVARVANAYEGILPINQICGHPVYSSKKAALKAWEDILNINYWPIFDTALKIY